MVKRFLFNIFVHDVINLWYHKISSKENSLGHCCRCHILYILQIIVIKRPNNHHSGVQNAQYVFHVYCHYRETLIHWMLKLSSYRSKSIDLLWLSIWSLWQRLWHLTSEFFIWMDISSPSFMVLACREIELLWIFYFLHMSHKRPFVSNLINLVHATRKCFLGTSGVETGH